VIVPEGYTEEGVLKLIETILANIAPRYTFGIYDADDMKQEGFIEALVALEAYDGSAPLENFLRTHLSRRLKNVKRNKSYTINNHCVNCPSYNGECEACQKRQRTQDMKKNVLLPIDIDVVDLDGEKFAYHHNKIDEVEIAEMVERVNRELPVGYRKDYLRMKEGLYVAKNRREEIENLINKILEPINAAGTW
jgi:DNA-directed RNA polymerase specialized sigma24 family protein